ncbi:PQQ-binding-like beta-propeller repeat protein [Qipengyuania sp. 1NDW9]|uniref:PQQ-binding-like beta-propeller repeat protein n=2 Tax=Qipengyuania TaxID=1855416 RepID=A0A9Q3XD78_9SPHN|nr:MULTISPECIES: PQQ-binding-like beta-propeller repeat protein [Qipengyuania]MBX7492584.1 PQQ-binding-like beta-propeller repeat protein [Qipengyuania xiapuensis]MBY6218244.1 PQQ-binding-like beta-propeller repeat protein [Qipengyuania aquimaris]QZD93214.1 PQQ-binding-like beta-propeller repeat protein [Qipengyuania xiapuensis]
MSQTTKPFLRTACVATLALALGACSGGLFGGGDGEKDTPTLGDRQPILSRIATGAEVDPALAGTPVTLPAATTNDTWGQAGGTASKSYGHLALAEAPARAFTASVEGAGERRRLGSAPVIGSGRLYAVGTDGRVTAFDAQTGARQWSYQGDLTDDTRASAFGGGVSYENGRLFGTDGAGNVYALDAETGAEQWKVKPGGPLRGSPTVAFGNVFVMSQDNQLFALDASNGSLQWQESGSTTMAGVFGVAAPAAGQGTVVAGYTSGELVSYRYENGRSLWADALARTSISTQVGALSDIDADPIIHNGRVYALGQGGRMAAYELVSGQRLWELNVAGISTPAIAGNWVFALTDEAKLMAIAADTGKVRWLTQLPRFRNEEKKKNPIFWQGPVLAGGQLWAVNSEGQVYRISTGEGSAAMVQELDEAISLPPVVANNTLYILDDSGTITAYR